MVHRSTLPTHHKFHVQQCVFSLDWLEASLLSVVLFYIQPVCGRERKEKRIQKMVKFESWRVEVRESNQGYGKTNPEFNYLIDSLSFRLVRLLLVHPAVTTPKDSRVVSVRVETEQPARMTGLKCGSDS